MGALPWEFYCGNFTVRVLPWEFTVRVLPWEFHSRSFTVGILLWEFYCFTEYAFVHLSLCVSLSLFLSPSLSFVLFCIRR